MPLSLDVIAQFHKYVRSPELKPKNIDGGINSLLIFLGIASSEAFSSAMSNILEISSTPVSSENVADIVYC